jgi:hypothetical protein
MTDPDNTKTDTLACNACGADVPEQCLCALATPPNDPTEILSEAAHDAWMESKHAQGITSRASEWGEELMAPYSALSERAKDLDRGTVRGVLNAVKRAGFEVRAALAAHEQQGEPKCLCPGGDHPMTDHRPGCPLAAPAGAHPGERGMLQGEPDVSPVPLDGEEICTPPAGDPMDEADLASELRRLARFHQDRLQYITTAWRMAQAADRIEALERELAEANTYIERHVRLNVELRADLQHVQNEWADARNRAEDWKRIAQDHEAGTVEVTDDMLDDWIAALRSGNKIVFGPPQANGLADRLAEARDLRPSIDIAAIGAWLMEHRGWDSADVDELDEALRVVVLRATAEGDSK